MNVSQTYIFVSNRIRNEGYKIYDFNLDIDLELISLISEIDRFGVNWHVVNHFRGDRTTIKFLHLFDKL